MRVLWDVFRNGQMHLFWMGMRTLPGVGDFYLWFYLVFAASSTMMPSESDRHGWRELAISIAVLFAITLLLGAGPWMLSNVAPYLSSFLGFVAVIFGLSNVVHVLLILPIALLHKLLARFTGVDVQ
jgi:membrane-associated HD superfamily phosphohydrolase